MSSLTLKFKDKVIEKFLVEKRNTLAIGRRTSNDIVIVNLAASGYHAEILPSDKGFILKDLDSKNGTLINGKRMTSSVLLKNDDIITIGKHTLIFQKEEQDHTNAQNQETDETSIVFEDPNELLDKTVIIDTNTLSKIKPFKKRKLQGFIELLSSEDEIALNKQFTTIGKHRDADIAVKGFLNFLIGDIAATISRRPDGYYISSMDGFLKPKINNKTLIRVMKLEPSDNIKIGFFKMKFFIK